MKEAYYRDGAKNRGDRVSNDQREMRNIAAIASTGNAGMGEGTSKVEKFMLPFRRFRYRKWEKKGKSTFFKVWNDIFPLKVAKCFDRIETYLIFKLEWFEKKVTGESKLESRERHYPTGSIPVDTRRFRVMVGDLLT